MDAGGAELERALAGLVAPDLLVLATAADAGQLADRRVARVGPSAWTVTPGYGRRAVDRVEGRDAEEALGRVARRLAGGTIGLALGAGGAYGFATSGSSRCSKRPASRSTTSPGRAWEPSSERVSRPGSTGPGCGRSRKASARATGALSCATWTCVATRSSADAR